MLPSNWFENSACKGCSYGERISGGVFCNEIQGLVPVGYQGCKAQNDYYDEMYKKENGITLTELAQELRKIFRFRYLTAEAQLGKIVALWTDKPFFTGYGWCFTDEAKCVLDIRFHHIPVLDLSEYKNKNGFIDYSKCIVEVA